jgi:hypothetical protein
MNLVEFVSSSSNCDNLSAINMQKEIVSKQIKNGFSAKNFVPLVQRTIQFLLI